MATNYSNVSYYNSSSNDNAWTSEDEFAQNFYVRLVYGILLGIIMVVSVAGGTFVSYVIISGMEIESLLEKALRWYWRSRKIIIRVHKVSLNPQTLDILGQLMKKAIWGYLLSLAISDTCNSLFNIPILIAACVDESYLKVSFTIKSFYIFVTLS